MKKTIILMAALLFAVSLNATAKADATTKKIMNQGVVLEASGVETWQLLDAGSSDERYFTVSRKVWYNENHAFPKYLIDSVEYTLYKKDMTVNKTVKVRTHDILTNDVRIQPEVTKGLFHNNANWEFVVFMHYWTDSVSYLTQNYKHLIMDETGTVLHTYDSTDAFLLHYNASETNANRTRFIVSKYVNYGDSIVKNEDTAAFRVYKVATSGTPRTITQQAEHRFGKKNLASFNSPMFNVKMIGTKAYYYIPSYEKPYYVTVPSAGQSTPNNKGVVELFAFSDSKSFKKFELPMPNWSNSMQITLGLWFEDFDFTTGVFDEDSLMDVMYGVGTYVANGDYHRQTYYVVNENGSIVKTTDRPLAETATAVKLADIAGEPIQYAVLEEGGTQISMFEPATWTWKTTFNITHEGERITSAINRIPENGSYVYLIGMYDPVKEGDTRYSMLNVYDKNGQKLRSTALNMGNDGVYTELIFTDMTLNPFQLNADGKREYLGLARTYSDATRTTYHNSIYIFNEDGDMIYRADDGDVEAAPNAKLSGSQGYHTLDGGKTPSYFILSYDNGSTYFFKMPFDTVAFNGSGSESEPYIISHVGELNAIRNNPTAHYKIVNDIDMALYCAYNEWVAIPNFAGTLDGGDYSIKNFTLSSKADYLGLFSTLKNNAVVKNLRLVDGTIKVNSNRYVGFVAGATEAAENLQITNVHVNNGTIAGAISSSTMIGGIIADAMGVSAGGGPKIDQCSFEGEIVAVGAASFGIGGIVGSVRSNVSISNCLSHGRIEARTSAATVGIGGILGQMRTVSKLDNCYSTMNIVGTAQVGGVVGYLNEQSKSKGSMSNCYATGRIEALSSNANQGFAGGVVGSSSTNSNNLDMQPDFSFIVNKKGVTMTGLVALNDSVMVATSNEYGAKRVIGVNNEAKNNLTAAATDGGFGALTADSIANCYALSSMIVGKVGEAATVTSSNSMDYEGADKTKAQLDSTFYASIGWKFGESTAKPWAWVGGQNPMLWYELVVSGISLNINELTLWEDSVYTLVATIYPTTATNQNVTWISTNPAVAEVAQSGVITAKTKGTAQIYAITEDGAKEAFCNVTVKRLTYTITATCGAQGTITPLGKVTLEKGADTTFTFAPNNPALYVVEKVLIDLVENAEATQSGTYTFTNVSTNHTIEVRFGLKTSIQDIENEDVMTVYPNPVVNGELNVDNVPLSAKSIEIYNLQGKLVETRFIASPYSSATASPYSSATASSYSAIVSQFGSGDAINRVSTMGDGRMTIDVSHLPNGTYIVKIGTATAKFVKK